MPSESDLLEGLSNASNAVDDGSLTGGEPVETQSAPSQVQETVAPSTSTDAFLSPDSVYADLPDAFRTGKTLDKLIEDVNARHQKALEDATSKYQGYEPFLEVPKENLAYAYQIFQMMDTKEGAQKVFDALVNSYGFSTAQAVNAMQQIQQQGQQEQDPEEELTPEQQKIRELEGKIAEFDQFKTQQQQTYQRAVEQEHERLFGEELDKALTDVYRFDETLAADTVRNDDLIARIAYKYEEDLRRGGKTSVKNIVQQAFNEQRTYNQHLYGKLSSQRQPNGGTVPIVMSPTGSNPAGNHTFDPKDENARDAEFARRLEELSQS
jgi:polyhydroxyalkanoate synthesis regulator phasin